MRIRFNYIAAAFVSLAALASCKKDLLKINTDPNSVSIDQYDPNNLLTATQLYYTGSSNNGIDVEETEIQGAGAMIQHFSSTSGYFFGDKYTLSPGGWGMFFDNVYTSTIKFAVETYVVTEGKSQYANLHQIARIMKAMAFERITDVYGDVPYFQAGLAYHQSIYFPPYDKQQDIYTDLLKEVSEAIDSLDENADQPAGDLFYAGDIGKWKRLGNSVLLKMAMRLTKVDPATAQKYVTQVQGNTMASNDDNAIVPHGTNDPLNINRIYRGIGEDGSMQLSAQLSQPFISYLKDNNDPRLTVYAYRYDTLFQPGDDPGEGIGSAAPEDQIGMPNGYDQATHNIANAPHYPGNIGLYSRMSPTVFNATAPTLVMTYAESELLLADAAKRWGIGDPEPHYHAGVVAAITMLSAFGDAGTISADNAEAWYQDNPYVDDYGLEQINDQYWVTTFMNEYEAWSNYRRTGFPSANPPAGSGLPALVPVSGYPSSQSPGAVPRRMEYSTVDKQVNAANYQAAVDRLTGGDKITSRVWWDTK